MLTIGKVAKRTGCSTSAIRYYERQGLLRAVRFLNGYRCYDEDAIERFRFLRHAQSLGITLKEIRRLLELTNTGRRPCEAVRELARQHLTDLEAKMRQLRSLRRQLRNLLSRPIPGHSDAVCLLISSAKT